MASRGRFGHLRAANRRAGTIPPPRLAVRTGDESRGHLV
jgi:hypothetical protein